jgi:hypothetical protein
MIYHRLSDIWPMIWSTPESTREYTSAPLANRRGGKGRAQQIGHSTNFTDEASGAQCRQILAGKGPLCF